VEESGEKPFFLVPAVGTLTEALSQRGLEFQVLAWPLGLASLTQRRWYALPLIFPGLLGYLFRLRAATRGAEVLWSSGFKSHFTCCLLAPWFRQALVFDIRDFLRPRSVRLLIAGVARIFHCRIRVNSKSVGTDYPQAEVFYPRVTCVRPPVNQRKPGGKRIITHLAFFAPYKGQDIFLDCASKLLAAGVDAEFWIIGDVIYPAEAYSRYREKVFAKAIELKLSNHVRFLGKVANREEVQALLEQTDLLIHCTRDPEPFGRSVMEALLCGCEVVCHRESGVCELTKISQEFPAWAKGLRSRLGNEYVSVSLP
jgi:glycosyltransferase involved in cell wall biosynthesis